MTRRLLTPIDWLIVLGGGSFIASLIVSAIFVPEIRWLHGVQASIYVVVIRLALRRNRWGYFIGASAAVLWNALGAFASPLFAELIDAPTRPDLLLNALAWAANLALLIGCIKGYQRLSDKSGRDLGRILIAFAGTTAVLVLATAVLAPGYLVAFTRAGHPHLPWHRS